MANALEKMMSIESVKEGLMKKFGVLPTFLKGQAFKDNISKEVEEANKFAEKIKAAK